MTREADTEHLMGRYTSPCSSPGCLPTGPLNEHRLKPATHLHTQVQRSIAPEAAPDPECQRVDHSRERMKDAEK